MSATHPQEAARLHLLRELAVLDTAPEPEFDAITRLIQRALGLPIALVSLVDQDRQWFKSRQGVDVTESPRRGSFCTHAVADERTLLVPDARKDLRFADNRLVTESPRIVFYAGVPLIVEGLPVGTVCVMDTQPHEETGEVVAQLEIAAGLVSRLLAARLVAERARAGEALAQATAQLNSDWAWQTDAAGRVIWLDQRHTAATGLDGASLLGRPLSGMDRHPLAGGHGGPAVDAAMKRGSAFRQLPLSWPTSTGSVALLFSGLPLHDAAGRVVGYRGTAFDPRRGSRAVARAEQAEKLLATAAEHFAGALMVAGADGRIVLANSCWRSLYARHMTGSPTWPDILRRAVTAGEFPQASDHEEAFIADRLDPPASLGAPLELLSNGRWWLTQEHRLPDGALLQVALDVTATKAAEARWRYHAELHQAVSSVSSDGIVVVDQYGDVVRFNPAAARMWRRTDAEMAALNIFAARIDGIDDRGRPLSLEEHPVHLALRQQSVVEGFRCGLEREDEPIQWFDLDVIPLGNASEAVMVLRDVTELRAASAARSVDERRSDGVAPLLPSAATQGAWHWSRRLSRMQLGRSCWQMLGYEGHEFQASDDVLAALAHRDDAEAARTTLDEQLGGDDCIVDLECRLRHRDGDHRCVMIRGRIHRDESGQPVEASGLITDITSQRAALVALADKRSAESASAAKTAFLSRVSHEIRTPLNAIVGFSRLLQINALPAQLQEPVACIHRAGTHLLGLVNDLLDAQRIEADSVALAMGPVSALEAVRSACELLDPEARAREVRLDVDDASLEGVWVHADAQRLRQILMNLVGNAVKYGRDGAVVRIRAVRHWQAVRLEVADQGPGLTPAQQARLFQPFERLGHERSGIPGTGLGLVICRRLAEAMGGHLDLLSAPDAGSTFWVELERADPAEARPPAMADAPHSGVGVGDGDHELDEPLTLAYVEDDPINVLLIERLIAKLPQWRLRVATSGAEARAMLADWSPDLLVLDAHLPDANGNTLLPELRARHRALADVPAVMFTADAMPNERRASEAAGFDRYWTKPINVDATLRELRDLATELRRQAA